MLGWLKRRPFPDRVVIDGREAVVTPTAVLRPGGPPCTRLGRPACGSWPRPTRSTARRGAAAPAPDDFEPLVLRFAPDEAFALGSTGVQLDDPDAIVEAEVGFVALMFPVDEFVDLVLPHIEWPAPAERPAFAQGSIAGVPAKLYIDSTGAATVFVLAAYLDDLLPRLPSRPRDGGLREDGVAAGYVATLPTLRWDEPKDAYDVVIVGGGGHGLSTAYYLATRHGITERRGPRGRLHRVGQHRPQHDDHPRQLRHPRGDPLLPALARDVPGARGRDRRRDPPPDQGHLLAGPHRDGAADRARPRADEHGRRRADRDGHAGRDQGARPADRPDRRRPLSGPRRVAPRRGGDRPPRPGRLGVRERRVAARRPRLPAHAGDRPASATATASSASRRRAARSRPARSLSAVGGRVTAVAAQAGVRLPIRTHPLHAFVTNDYAQGFGPIVAATELICYVSQTERGQMLIGAEFDAQPSYSRQSSFAALRALLVQDHPPPAVPARPADPADMGRASATSRSTSRRS